MNGGRKSMSSYNIVAEQSKSTVVAEYTPSAKKERSYQSEATLEADLIETLKGNGYDYLKITKNNDLVANLRAQLSKLNDYRFSDKEWEQIFNNYLANSNEAIEEKTRKIHEDFIFVLRQDNGKTKNIKKNVTTNDCTIRIRSRIY